MKTGIIDVGGGFRGVFAAGVQDCLLDRGISFDLGIGISAGSGNLAAFTAGQRGRAYRFYSRYALRKEYVSLRNFLFKGTFIDQDYAYDTLCRSGGEDPLDYAALAANPMDLRVVATVARTGQAIYFTKDDIRPDDYQIMKASSAIPFISKPYAVNGVPCFDGALSDPVPVETAFRLGCDRVLLILTKPASIPREPKHDPQIARLIRRKYPECADRLLHRAEVYNASVALAREYEKQGKVMILSPDDTCGVDTLTRDPAAMQRLYDKGYAASDAAAEFLKT